MEMTLLVAVVAFGRRRLLWVLWCLGASLTGRAQDLIMRADQTPIQAQVLEVRGSQIFYKKWGQPDKPTTVISTDYVQYVQYQDGRRQVFAPPPALSPSADDAVNLRRNIIGIRPVDLYFTNLTLAYERLVWANRLGIKVPVTLGINHNRYGGYGGYGTAFYQRNKTFSTGLELNFYLSKAERFRYFVGPAVQWGRFRYGYVSHSNPGLAQVRLGQHLAVVAAAGIWYQVGSRFVFSADGSVGWQTKLLDRTGYPFYNEQLDRNAWFRVSGNLNFGYQF